MIKVLPSTNPCPENKLLDYSKELYNLGIEYLHCDVMDGKFVKNKCLDYEVLRYVRDNCNILLDVHLMVEDVFEKVLEFSKLKPNIITVHYESLKNEKEFNKIYKLLKSKDILLGLSIKPNTSIDSIKNLLNKIDLLLIMTVEPGKSGQTFLENSIDKIRKAKDLIKDKDIILEVDGGINENTYEEVINAGAEFLVIGSAIYNATNRKKFLVKIDKHYKN